MRDKLAPQRHDLGTQIKPVPAHVLVDRINAVHDMIARRAYEIFESRGRADGHVLEDWEQAESETVTFMQTRRKGISRSICSSR